MNDLNKEQQMQDQAILDAAARFYGQHIAQGGVQALAAVAQQLGRILEEFRKDSDNA